LNKHAATGASQVPCACPAPEAHAVARRAARRFAIKPRARSPRNTCGRPVETPHLWLMLNCAMMLKSPARNAVMEALRLLSPLNS
jgi:hypothetical protein